MSTIKKINYYFKETDVNQTGNSLNTGSFEITPFFNTAFNSTFKKQNQIYLFSNMVGKDFCSLN